LSKYQKVAYYPGCALEGTGHAYNQSTKVLGSALGLKLDEVKNWNCCGAMEVKNIDPKVQTYLSSRVMSIAANEMGADVVIAVDVSADALWTSGDASIALLTPTPGVFDAISAGVTTVTATLGVSGTASLEVTDTPPVRALAALRIDGNEPPFAVGGVAQLRALGTWNDGVEEDLSALVAWSSSDPGVLSIDAAGLAEAVAAGAVTVTALHAPSSLAAQAAVQVLADRPVEALVVRMPARIVAASARNTAALPSADDVRAVNFAWRPVRAMACQRLIADTATTTTASAPSTRCTSRSL